MSFQTRKTFGHLWNTNYDIFDESEILESEIKKKILIEHQIGELEWFLKDHVTLKNDVMASNDLALPWQE